MQGLTDLAQIGVIKNESLPNIKGTAIGNRTPWGWYGSSGAFSNGGDTSVPASSYLAGLDSNTAGRSSTLLLNASHSSSTYQDNASVQQEAVQYPYAIVVNIGVEEAERPINNYQVNNVYSYGMSQYYKGDMTNLSWLKSAGQWNDGTVYTGIYNWLLEQMNAGVSGFLNSTATYTDYDFVINTTDQTFRLPLKAELDVIPSGYNLYYYVGDTLQNAQLINIARIEEKLTDMNATSRGYLVESYKNGTEWYRVYSDGWIEQGGQGASGTGDKTITLYKTFTNTSYTIVHSPYSSAGAGSYSSALKTQTNSTFIVNVESNYVNGFYWYACGY